MPQSNKIDQGSVETFDSAGHPTSSMTDVGKDLATMNARIDDIVAFQKRKDPWFRDTRASDAHLNPYPAAWK